MDKILSAFERLREERDELREEVAALIESHGRMGVRISRADLLADAAESLVWSYQRNVKTAASHIADVFPGHEECDLEDAIAAYRRPLGKDGAGVLERRLAKHLALAAAVREWTKGCSCTQKPIHDGDPAGCEECTRAFLGHVKRLAATEEE
jgi:hypothetical protein